MKVPLFEIVTIARIMVYCGPFFIWEAGEEEHAFFQKLWHVGLAFRTRFSMTTEVHVAGNQERVGHPVPTLWPRQDKCIQGSNCSLKLLKRVAK